MAINIQSIQFNHQLFDVSNKSVKTFKIQIQIYNIYEKSWMSITDHLALASGKLAYLLKIPSRISTKNQTVRVVREVLKSGGTPSFRVIKVSKTKLPEVISTTFEASITTDTKLTIDFDKSWMLHPDNFILKSDHIIVASQVPIFELTNEIHVIKEERENAVVQLTGLNNTISSLSKERETLQNQLLSVQNDIQNTAQEVSNLNVSLETTKTDFANERALRETLQTEKITLETQIAAQRNQIDAMEVVKEDTNKFEVLYNGLQQEVANITIERDNLNQEKVSFQASISQLQDSIKREKVLVTSKNKEIQNKQTLIDSLENEKQVLQKELDETKDFTVTDHPNKLSASKVYSSIVNDVVKADTELVNSKYKLANVSLKLKTTVEKGPNGTVFGLLDYESAKDVNSAAISDISIDVVPTATTSTTVEQKMPNILGLTETAVRKVLFNNGLKLDAVYHPTNDETLIAGQAFKQSPVPDASIAEGQEVIVIFAKPIN